MNTMTRAYQGTYSARAVKSPMPVGRLMLMSSLLLLLLFSALSIVHLKTDNRVLFEAVHTEAAAYEQAQVRRQELVRQEAALSTQARIYHLAIKDNMVAPKAADIVFIDR
jgi:cell division protein FtsL